MQIKFFISKFIKKPQTKVFLKNKHKKILNKNIYYFCRKYWQGTKLGKLNGSCKKFEKIEKIEIYSCW